MVVHGALEVVQALFGQQDVEGDGVTQQAHSEQGCVDDCDYHLRVNVCIDFQVFILFPGVVIMWKQWLVARDSPRQRAVAMWTRKVEIHDVSCWLNVPDRPIEFGPKSEEATFYKVGGHAHPLEPGWWRTAEWWLEPTTLPPLLFMFKTYTTIVLCVSLTHLLNELLPWFLTLFFIVFA